MASAQLVCIIFCLVLHLVDDFWLSSLITAYTRQLIPFCAFPLLQFPYYTFVDRSKMYSVGSLFYAIYFFVSFPMFMRIDEDPKARKWSLGEVSCRAVQVQCSAVQCCAPRTWDPEQSDSLLCTNTVQYMYCRAASTKPAAANKRVQG